jgi:hypothetical protein
MTPFTIGADTAYTGTVCGKVSRGARGLGAADVAGTRRRGPRLPLALHRGAVSRHG